MPHIDKAREKVQFDPITAVIPVAGNNENGGAAYDPSTNEALYAVYHNTRFRVFRTTGGYKELARINNSVTELSVIVDAAFGPARSVGLTRIGGELYANVVGLNLSTEVAGNWIYRDTSTARDGSGPWILHGTVRALATPGYTETTFPNKRSGGGEIITLPSGRWFVAHEGHFTNPEGHLDVRAGFSYSDDAGSTWTIGLELIYGLSGLARYDWTRGPNSFGKWNGRWYAGFSSNVFFDAAFYTTDGETWIGPLHTEQEGISQRGPNFVFSLADYLYRQRNLGADQVIERAAGNPEDLPAWVEEYDEIDYFSGQSTTAFTHYCIIGPDSRPFLVGILNGEVLPAVQVIGGWRLWVSE